MTGYIQQLVADLAECLQIMSAALVRYLNQDEQKYQKFAHDLSTCLPRIWRPLWNHIVNVHDTIVPEDYFPSYLSTTFGRLHMKQLALRALNIG